MEVLEVEAERTLDLVGVIPEEAPSTSFAEWDLDDDDAASPLGVSLFDDSVHHKATPVKMAARPITT